MRPIYGPQPEEDHPGVRFNGLDRDPELAGDGFVSQTLGHQSHNVLLPRRQTRRGFAVALVLARASPRAYSVRRIPP